MNTTNRLVASIVLGAVTLVGTAGAASAAAPPVSSTRAVAVVAAPAAAPAAAAAAAAAATSVPAPGTPSVIASPFSIARAIIAVIQRFGGWFSKLYSAVKGGYRAYVNFVNDLPWYIKYPVKAVSPLVLTYDVWSALNSLM